jgi:hypothetical protein
MQYLPISIASALILTTSTSWSDQNLENPKPIQPEHQMEQMKKIDSEREMKMIMLYQQLNKKSNKVEQLTNEIKSPHNT